MFIQFFFGVGFFVRFLVQSEVRLAGAYSMVYVAAFKPRSLFCPPWRVAEAGYGRVTGSSKMPCCWWSLTFMNRWYIYIFNYIVWNHVAVCGLYTLEVSTIGICLVDIAHWSMDPFWKDHLSSGGSLVRQISRIFTSLPRSLDQQNSQHHHCKWCQVRKISPYVYVYVYIYTHIRIYVY